MTPLPKKKRTKSESAARLLHVRLTTGSLAKCSNCGKLKRPHRACPYCGNYK